MDLFCVFQDLLKHTPKDHPDFPLLQDALRISQNFLSSINEEIDPRRTAVTTPKGEVCPAFTKLSLKVKTCIWDVRQEVTLSILSGTSAGEGWLPGGGVGKFQEVTARLPLHRFAALCQDEKDSRRVSLTLASVLSKVCIDYPLHGGFFYSHNSVLHNNVNRFPLH